MDEIIRNLKEPSWWFSAFFMAIVASVVAGFLKDRVERYLSELSSRFKTKRAASIAARKAVIDALVEHPTYLTLAFHRATLRMILYVMTMLLFLSTPILLEASPPEHDTFMWLGQKELFRKYFMPAMGLLSGIIGFKATSSLSIAFDALKAFREKHDLPKLP